MLNTLDYRTPAGCISDLVFDEWMAAELSDDRVRELRAHLDGCTRCRERENSLRATAAGFLQEFPSLSLPMRETRRGLRQRPGVWSTAAGLLAVAAALFLFLRFSPESEGVRSKGGPHLGFFVKRGARVFRGADGETVFPGDRLRFTATTVTATHLAVLSLDARGVASIYYPTDAEMRRIGPASELALDGSVELDDTLGDERLFALFCESSVPVSPLRKELETTRALAPPQGCRLDVLRLVKERTR